MWNNHIGKKKNQEETIKTQGTIKNDFFQMFFGNLKEKEEEKPKSKKKIPVKGENIETEINVTIEEAFKGLEKKLSLRTVNRKNENIYHKSTGRD